MNKIKYINGDLFQLVPKDGSCVIPHVCNNFRAFGAGFVLPLKKHYPQAEAAYLKMPQILGSVGFVDCDEVLVANMIAQDFSYNPIPLYYDALAACMVQVKYFCLAKGVSVFAPLFGCGLAGGDAEKIEKMMKHYWTDNDIDVTVCVYE